MIAVFDKVQIKDLLLVMVAVTYPHRTAVHLRISNKILHCERTTGLFFVR